MYFISLVPSVEQGNSLFCISKSSGKVNLRMNGHALQNGVDLVNRELALHNTGEKLKLVKDSYFDAAAVIKCVFGLIQRSARTTQLHQDTESRLEQLTRENAVLETSMVRLCVFCF